MFTLAGDFVCLKWEVFLDLASKSAVAAFPTMCWSAYVPIPSCKMAVIFRYAFFLPNLYSCIAFGVFPKFYPPLLSCTAAGTVSIMHCSS